MLFRSGGGGPSSGLAGLGHTVGVGYVSSPQDQHSIPEDLRMCVCACVCVF